MEIKVLEHRDSVKKAVDEQEKTFAHLKALDQVLAAANEACFAAAKASRLKEEKYATILENLKELETQLATAENIYGALQQRKVSNHWHRQVCMQCPAMTQNYRHIYV